MKKTISLLFICILLFIEVPYLVYAQISTDDGILIEEFKDVAEVNFEVSDQQLGQSVQGWNNWRLYSVPANRTFTSTIESDPKNSTNKVLKLRRTATSTLNERPYYTINLDNQVQKLEGQVYVGLKLFSEKVNNTFSVTFKDSGANSGNIMLATNFTSGGTLINGYDWTSISTKGYPRGQWFDLEFLIDTKNGTYDIYINGEKMNTQSSLALYPATLATRHISVIELDIKKEATSEVIWYADDIVFKRYVEEVQPEYKPDKNIVLKQNFEVDPKFLNRSVHTWNNWALTNNLSVPTMTTTIAMDPGNPSSSTYSGANKVMKLRRTTSSLVNERPYYQIKVADEIQKLTGRFNVEMRLKAEKSNGYFAVALRDNENPSGNGNYIANSLLYYNGTVRNSADWATVATNAFPQNEWFTYMLSVDTVKKTYDIYINGNMINTAPLVFQSNTENPYVSVLEIDIKKEVDSDTVWYADDLVIWRDYADEITTLVNSLTDAVISNNKLNEITGDLNQLPVNLGNGYSVNWQSDNENAVTSEGDVTTRNYTQKAILTATVTKDTQIPYLQHASLKKSYNLTILPHAGISDADVINDLNETFLTESYLTSEPLDAITVNLKNLPVEELDGVRFIWSSNRQDIITNLGKVTRPLFDLEDVQVELSVQIIKGAESSTKTFLLSVKKQLSPNEKIAIAMANINYQTITSEAPQEIKYSLNLPIEGLEGVKIDWVSEQTDIINNNGSVIRGDRDYNVLLTAYFISDSVCQQSEFNFLVKMSPVIQLEADLKSIDLENSNTVTESFGLPLTGAVYSSNIEWKSNNKAIAIHGGTAVVIRPEFAEGDANVNLTATLIIEDKILFKVFNIIVTKLPSDELLVDEIFNYLTYERINAEQQDNVFKNLAFPTSFSNGVTCEWISNNEQVVTNTGMVINPPIGSGNVDVKLIAKMKKRNAIAQKTFDITVRAFATTTELLEKAKTNLNFNVFSDESIDCVTYDISLPNNWLYDTTITWRIDNSSVMKISQDESGHFKGLVYRPQFDAGSGSATLFADISYGEQNVTKTFLLKIKSQEQYITIYNHTFENYNIGDFPMDESGICYKPDAGSGEVEIVNDPLDFSNKVAEFFKIANSTAIGSEYYIFYHNNYTTYSGLLTMSGKLFADQDISQSFMMEIIGYNGTQVPIYFYEDGKIGCQITNKGAYAVAKTDTYRFPKGEWLNFRIELDTNLKYYHIYINDQCVTTDGNLYLNGNAYSTIWGVPFYYFDDPTRSTAIKGYRVSFLKSINVTDSLVYFDNFSLVKLYEYDSTLTEACSAFERKFLENTDIFSVTNNINIPQLENSRAKLTFYSSDTSVLKTDGTVKRRNDDVKVTLTAVFTLGNVSLKRPFELIVKSKNLTDMTNDEIAKVDLSETISKLKGSYNFQQINNNISFILVGDYGSQISYDSDNKGALSDSGVITAQSQDKSVNVKVLAKKGDATATESILLIIKAEKSIISVGRGSTKVANIIYGQNNKTNSGIVLEEPNKSKKDFPDVPTDYWAYEPIMRMVGKNIISASSDVLFEPERAISREEFVKLVVCAFALKPGDINVDFADVNTGEWYYQYVKTLASNGIISGIDDRHFGVGEQITRQDMAVILYKAAKFSVNDLLPIKSGAVFIDEARIADYAHEAVNALFANGVIGGEESGLFNPINLATRAQAAKIIWFMISKL